MVFRRRDRPPFLTRARQLVLPRTGWKRAIEYIAHRVRRIPDTPHRIALGFACGVMASFNPFFGLHFVIALAFAWAVRGNLFASMVGTFVGNPLTFPLIASVSLPLGRRILGHGASGRDFARVSEAFTGAVEGLGKGLGSLFGYGTPEWGKVWTLVADVMWPYFVGGVLPGLAASVLAYWLIRPIVAAYQAAMRARRAERVRRRAGAGGREAG